MDTMSTIVYIKTNRYKEQTFCPCHPLTKYSLQSRQFYIYRQNSDDNMVTTTTDSSDNDKDSSDKDSSDNDNDSSDNDNTLMGSKRVSNHPRFVSHFMHNVSSEIKHRVCVLPHQFPLGSHVNHCIRRQVRQSLSSAGLAVCNIDNTRGTCNHTHIQTQNTKQARTSSG